ncbi:MAG TPA: helix-turn-helix domain-containing protein, partial [Euzebyales bacterium]|nr:helix-turn-helix domain-containing protein [Euzebyales bacterium]
MKTDDVTATDAGDREQVVDPRVDVVLRLLRGEQLAHLAEQANVPAETLLAWRDAFLAGGRERLANLPEEPVLVAVTHGAR